MRMPTGKSLLLYREFLYAFLLVLPPIFDVSLFVALRLRAKHQGVLFPVVPIV